MKLQRITNCILTSKEQCLLLQKPSKGWWVAPGGKMEPTETIQEAAIRELKEETGLLVMQPELQAVTTMVIVNEDDSIQNEWMMFTFKAVEASGQLFKHSPEGKLQWQPNQAYQTLPMAEGDRLIFDHVFHGEGILYSTFYYDTSHNLLKERRSSAST
ncbi:MULTISPECIES: NUDIX hydrolase [Shouchella]|uniref:Nudix hydrolase n=1 Tax=Shouchella lehensis G1 TaxID=1246626 RepID=A0A060M4W5_9BACI|nr:MULTISPECIES: 8-oxo-dGTP diphosphatase [Bacillaceae]AIC95573.1 Nudix hydrolase [Shouchella lehensis G1]